MPWYSIRACAVCGSRPRGKRASLAQRPFACRKRARCCCCRIPRAISCVIVLTDVCRCCDVCAGDAAAAIGTSVHAALHRDRHAHCDEASGRVRPPIAHRTTWGISRACLCCLRPCHSASSPRREVSSSVTFVSLPPLTPFNRCRINVHCALAHPIAHCNIHLCGYATPTLSAARLIPAAAHLW